MTEAMPPTSIIGTVRINMLVIPGWRVAIRIITTTIKPTGSRMGNSAPGGLGATGGGGISTAA